MLDVIKNTEVAFPGASIAFGQASYSVSMAVENRYFPEKVNRLMTRTAKCHQSGFGVVPGQPTNKIPAMMHVENAFFFAALNAGEIVALKNYTSLRLPLGAFQQLSIV